ncbi:hypothetical protein WL99_20100 [Burkholderia cepacia]|uniref:hypothetical protein n=1 Tax=Burkholderia cepacia TaxID=292 RepID=UPI0007524E36|nr:hypothetical protein [Burkholderia cepacia]KWH27657.1 hypothetical protein WL99_20100 [Burkholderia cepacia]
MRGLDIRVSFALARIALIADPENTDIEEVMWNAVGMGRDDYRCGLELPIMFADEPALANSWKQGNADAALSEELENCPDCIAACGDPCPIHG